MNTVKDTSYSTINPQGSACEGGNVCPNAAVSECNQTPGYQGQSSKWTSTVQATMSTVTKD